MLFVYNSIDAERNTAETCGLGLSFLKGFVLQVGSIPRFYPPSHRLAYSLFRSTYPCFGVQVHLSLASPRLDVLTMKLFLTISIPSINLNPHLPYLALLRLHSV